MDDGSGLARRAEPGCGQMDRPGGPWEGKTERGVPLCAMLPRASPLAGRSGAAACVMMVAMTLALWCRDVL